MRSLLTAARRRAVSTRSRASVIPVLLLVACDIPTSAPIIESRWVVPAQTTRIGVANLLPAGVTIAGDSAGFMVSVPATTVSRTLLEDCALCAAASGYVHAKPAFTIAATSTAPLPADVAAATLVSGAIRVDVVNNNTFDPLRPSAADGSLRGFAIITIASGSIVLGRDSVDGATTTLPANGGTLFRAIPLLGRVTGNAPLTISLLLSSPAGDPVLIDASKTIVVSLSPASLKVASASVSVVGRRVTSTTTLNLGSVDSAISKRVQSGALLMTVRNPFDVAGTLTATFSPDGGSPLLKTVALTAGSSSPTVSFTASELRGLLGRTVQLTLSGPVSSRGSVSVSPRDVVVVTTQFDLGLEVGGSRTP